MLLREGDYDHQFSFYLYEIILDLVVFHDVQQFFEIPKFSQSIQDIAIIT